MRRAKAVDVASTQLDQAKAVVAEDQASLAQAQLNLDHTRILAPVDGTVESRNMDVGQTVAASFSAPVIFLIAQDLTKMQVDTNVDESDVGPIRLDQPATFTVDAYPGQMFRGRVAQIRQAPINVQNVITYDIVIAGIQPGSEAVPRHDGQRHYFDRPRIERPADSQGGAAFPSARRQQNRPALPQTNQTVYILDRNGAAQSRAGEDGHQRCQSCGSDGGGSQRRSRGNHGNGHEGGRQLRQRSRRGVSTKKLGF